MKRTTTLLGLAAAMTATVVVLASAPASAATIQSGHIDALDIDYDAGAGSLSLDIKTYSPANDDLSPAGTTLRIVSSSTITIPEGEEWGCLGPAGDTAYVAPQTFFFNRLYAGWNTEDVPAAQGPVKLELVSWSGPANSRFVLYVVDGDPQYKINTNGAGGCSVSVWPGGIGGGGHAHGNWAFSHLGTYTLTLRASAQNGAGASSGDVTYTFQVG